MPLDDTNIRTELWPAPSGWALILQWHVAFNILLIVIACATAVLVVRYWARNHVGSRCLVACAGVGLGFAIFFAAMAHWWSAIDLGEIVDPYLNAAYLGPIPWLDIAGTRSTSALHLGHLFADFFDKILLASAVFFAGRGASLKLHWMILGAAAGIGYSAVLPLDTILDAGAPLHARLIYGVGRSTIYAALGAMAGFVIYPGRPAEFPIGRVLLAALLISGFGVAVIAVSAVARDLIDTLARHRQPLLDEAIISLIIFWPLALPIFIPMLHRARRDAVSAS